MSDHQKLLNFAPQLANLGQLLFKHIEMVFILQNNAMERKRKDAILTLAAHTLSLPLVSIIADASNLMNKLNQNENNFSKCLHLLNEAKNLQLVVKNLLNEADRNISQASYSYEKKPIFPLIKETCSMFASEAAEKGCDIFTFIELGDALINIDYPFFDDDKNIYYRLYYGPKLKQLGNHAQYDQSYRDIRTHIYIDTEGREVNPVDLPRECYKIINEYTDDDHRALKVYMDTSAEKNMKLDPTELSNLYMPRVEMVRDELMLAIKNIVSNAIKYSFRALSEDERRHIKVICKRDGNRYYKISVENFGVGIHPLEIEEGMIWRRGYRGIFSRDRNRPGVGLGLSQAQYAIEKIHGGMIEAQSLKMVDNSEDVSHPPYKTTFMITIPIKQHYRLKNDKKG